MAKHLTTVISMTCPNAIQIPAHCAMSNPLAVVYDALPLFIKTQDEIVDDEVSIRFTLSEVLSQ